MPATIITHVVVRFVGDGEDRDGNEDDDDVAADAGDDDAADGEDAEAGESQAIDAVDFWSVRMAVT